MKTLIKNIGLLAGIVPEGVLRKEGAEMAETGMLENAWILVEDGRIADFGEMGKMPDQVGHDEVIDAEGGMVMPAFCDSHTHIVYAGSREGEFLDKIRGLSYEEIAARGGGILNSSDLLHRTSEDDLYAQSMVRVREMMAHGTGAMEIKSGYGLNPEDELKMLRVIARIKESVPAIVRSTYLGAHAVGRGYCHDEYVQTVIDTTPEAARYADFIDVFCDEGFFTPEDTARILEAGAAAGLRPKIHANELAVSGGVEVGVRYNALSVDHLERTTPAQIDALNGSATMPTMLPGSSFFLGIPFGNARGFIDAGLPLALASDYNPGSSPSGDMRFVMALGCIRMRLTPVEAFNAVTLNSAYAMGISDIAGSITRGKQAKILLTEPGWNLTRLAYHYRTPWLRQVIL
jgi:imidazolonepropionase